MNPNKALSAVTFARRVFRAAGIYGLLVTAPQIFLEGVTSRDFPPTITHPEFYYGFVGTVVAWQVAFLVIGQDPLRYRPLMLVSVLEKAVFATAVPVLYLQGRVPALLLVFAAIDLILALLFVEAFRRSGGAGSSGDRSETRRLPAEARAVELDHGTELLILDLRRALDDGPRVQSHHGSGATLYGPESGR